MSPQDISELSLRQIQVLKSEMQVGLTYELLHEELIRRRKSAYQGRLSPEELKDHQDYLEYMKEVRGCGR